MRAYIGLRVRVIEGDGGFRVKIGLRVRVIEGDGGLRVKIDLHRFKG